ncbi:MAG: TIR domain-containing protein [Chloroflexi bacterium]|nr:TIR domain-containing protein [Chloroflexota bacterium]
MTKVFISYSRKDKVFAGRLTEALGKSELETWIDWEDIPPTADWMDQIHKGIEQADAFLFLLSPDSVASKVCEQEVDHAVQNGKRLIPIVARDVNPNDVHPALGKVNWIYCRESDDFDGAVNKTLSAIRTDLVWVESQRRLQVKALEWDKRKDTSLLLRGKDLQEAELQLAVNTSKDPSPTDLQREYVLESRRAADRQRRIVTGISIAGVIVMAVLAVFGFVQAGLATNNANEAQKNASTAQAASTLAFNNAATAQANEKLAEERATIARAGELDAQAISTRGENTPLSYLLSVEALNLLENSRTKRTLLENIQNSPYLTGYLNGHSGHVTSVALSPDGKMLASGSVDKTIVLWDMEAHQQLGEPLRGHSDSVTTLAFSPDGKTLASGSADKTVIFWDVEKHKQLGTPLIGYGNPVRSVVFSPDGKTLASDSEASLIFLWDVATRKLIGEPFDGFAYATPSSVSSGGGGGGPWEGSGGCNLAFSPDGKILASGRVYNAVILWNVETHQPIGASLEENETNMIGDITQNEVTSVAFSADGMTLAAGYQNGDVNLWDLTLQQPVVGERLTGHEGAIYSLAFNEGFQFLASMSSDGTVILWDRWSRELLAQLPSGHSSPTNFVFTSTWNLALGSYDTAVAIWHVETILREAGAFSGFGKGKGAPQAVPLSIGHIIGTSDTGEINSVAFSPDGKVLAYSVGATIQVWDVVSHKQISEFSLGYMPYSIAFAPNGKILAVGDFSSYGGRGGIVLWDVKNGKPISEVFGSNIWKLSFAPDGKTLSSVSMDGIITSWDVGTQQVIGKPIETHSEYGFSSQATFNKEVSLLASAERGNARISIWNLSTGQVVGYLLTNESSTGSVVFSPDGKTLASAGDEGIKMWDLTSSKQIGIPFGDSTRTLDFSPDAKTLVSDSTLWDMEKHQAIGSLLESVNRALFSPDGSVLFTSAYEDFDTMPVIVNYLWDMQPRVWAEHTCQRAGRNLAYSEWLQYFPEEPYRKICPDIPIHPSVIDHFFKSGDHLASSGKIEAAIAAYQDAINLLPILKHSVPDLRARAERKFSESLLQQGDEAASANNLQLALDKYNTALKHDANTLGGVSPSLRVRAKIAVAITELNLGREHEDMVLKFIDARVMFPDFMENVNIPSVLNNTCWRGSLTGHALEVKDACERALELSPDNGGYADSRGLNRALMGDFEGAIKDFKSAISWFRDHGHADYAEEREEWIAALQIGQNPFDQQTLEALKNE